MVKAELGTKRICPETGRKFYDLNKDPIVSPYTGTSYPLSYFESTGSSSSREVEEEVEDKEAETEDEGAETISLEEADEEAGNSGDDDDDDDVDLGDDDDDTFLADDEDDGDDVSGIIDVEDEDED